MTYSLVEMVREGGKKVSRLTDLWNQARELDLHYIPSRYPNGIPSGYPHRFYGMKVAEQALIAAEKVFSTVRDHFQAEGESEILRVDDGEKK